MVWIVLHFVRKDAGFSLRRRTEKLRFSVRLRELCEAIQSSHNLKRSFQKQTMEDKMNLSQVIIKTNRLLLVPISPKLREAIFQNLTKEITKYMYPQPTGNIKDTDDFIERSSKKNLDGIDLQLIITDLESGEFLGCAGMHHIDQRSPELGIWLKKDAHGHKYGQEAMRAIKEWADKNIRYLYIKYPVAKANIPSRKVAESLGGVLIHEVPLINQLGEEHVGVEYFIYPPK